jgi:hypothetical protein
VEDGFWEANRGAGVEFSGRELAGQQRDAGQPGVRAGLSTGLLIFQDDSGGDGSALRTVFRGRQAVPLLKGAHEMTSFRDAGERQYFAERKRRGPHQLLGLSEAELAQKPGGTYTHFSLKEMSEMGH